jgi:non-heme chloroperoxidase
MFHSEAQGDEISPIERMLTCEIDAFNQIHSGVLADCSPFFQDLAAPFYGDNRPGAKLWQGRRDSSWLQGMHCGFKAV